MILEAGFKTIICTRMKPIKCNGCKALNSLGAVEGCAMADEKQLVSVENRGGYGKSKLKIN